MVLSGIMRGLDLNAYIDGEIKEARERRDVSFSPEQMVVVRELGRRCFSRAREINSVRTRVYDTVARIFREAERESRR